MLCFTIVKVETENLFGVQAIKLESYAVENIKDPNTFLLLLPSSLISMLERLGKGIFFLGKWY